MDLVLLHPCGRRSLIDAPLAEVHRQIERLWIDGRKGRADRHLLVVLHLDMVDNAGDLGRHFHEVRSDIGVLGIGDEQIRHEIEEGNDRNDAHRQVHIKRGAPRNVEWWLKQFPLTTNWRAAFITSATKPRSARVGSFLITG